jgi:hypothetical protein
MNRHALKVTRYTLILFLVIALVGCDAFVRKFTRKPKKDNLPQEEMVIVPEEYKGPGLSKDELYRQYFLFWKSWQDELIESLLQNKSQKKQLDCSDEAIKSLENLKALLDEVQQNNLNVYINQLKDLKSSIEQDLYNSNTFNNRHTAERIRISIMQKFSYDKIKNNLL